MPQSDEPVAIVGIGCRFPGGVADPAAFWSLLSGGVDAVTEIPPHRWSVEQFYHPDPQVLGTTYSKWGGFVENIDLFDPGAFGISPREALSMDPQQRMMLEVTLEALEDAGLNAAALRGSKTGVFAGISTWDYSQLLYESGSQMRVDPYAATGTALSIVANRISYCFDFHGPSLVVDTACSSSLVAVHLACESLRSGECALAVAGGVNLFLSPANAIAFSKMGVLSPDGRCKAFDASANGFVRAEGAGVVILKPLSSAIRNSDRIYAVLRATGVNQDGVTNGLAVPNGRAQAELIRETFARAGLDPHRVAYVETHGTGTTVGDPTEAQALGETIGRGRPGGPCLIGSVKTNIGHLESGAGIAGLIKAALVVHHRQVPPSLHFRTPNPNIDFAALRLEVATTNRPLPGAGAGSPPLAAVNSFGFGGTNAFAVLSAPEEGAANARPAKNGRLHLLPISAASEARLDALADAWVAFLPGADDLEGVGRTAALRREHRTHRLCVAAATGAEAAARLKAFRSGERTQGVAAARADSGEAAPKVAFVFSGQGPQWWAMGRGLYESDPVYRRTIDECDQFLRRIGGWSLVELLSAPEEASRIRETAIAQPALCALQIALTEVWRSRGITPAATAGHSVGELAAAHAAGRLTLEEAMRIVWHRGDCIARFASRGAMLAAALPPENAREITASGEYSGVAIAAFNSPNNVTMAGDAEKLSRLAAWLEQEGIHHQFLNVDYAFHSALMDAAEEPFLTAISGAAAHAGSIPWISTVTGSRAEDDALDAGYWWRNVRQPVHFAQAVERMLDEGCSVFVEIGPHPVLLPSITECVRSRGLEPRVAYSLRRDTDEPTSMLTNFGLLHCWGCAVDWRALYPAERPPVALPRHPWLRESFWCAGKEGHRPWLAGRPHPILGSRVALHKPVWWTRLDLRRLPFLAQHRLQNRALLPATAYIDMAMAAAHELLGVEHPVLENLELRKALFLPPEPDVAELLVEYEPAERELRFFSRLGGSLADWTLHCRMRLGGDAGSATVPRFDRAEAVQRCPESFPGEIIYEMGEASQLEYGTLFRGLKHFWRSSCEVVARIELAPELEPSGGGYFFHPAFLDACVQAGNLNRPFGISSNNLQQVTFVPVGAGEMRLFRKPVSRILWVHVIKTRDTARHQCGDVRIYDDDGSAVLFLRAFESQGMERRGGSGGASIDDWAYRVAFVPKALAQNRPRPVAAPALPMLIREMRTFMQALTGDSSGTTRFERLRQKLDALALTWWEHAFRALGLERCTGRPSNFDEILCVCGIAAQQARYAKCALTCLTKAGVLTSKDGVWQVSAESARRADPSSLWREILAEFPAANPEIMILHILGTNLTALLTGQTTLQEQLFNRAAEGLLDHFYQDSVGLITSNATVAKAVARLVRESHHLQKIRILEIGAGTGGATTHILPLLEGRQVEYVFTDVSPAFLNPAKRRHADHAAFMDFRLLDLEKDPVAQGFAAGEFDIIVAANVLHAVPDISRSLRHIGQLLAPGGCFCLLEVVEAPCSLHFIFGLTQPWWIHQDERMQPVSRREWQRHLEREFPHVCELSDVPSAPSAQLAEVAVFLAKTDAAACPGDDAPPALEDAPAADSRKHWLILADRQQLAAELAARLAACGAASRLLPADEGAGRIADEMAAATAAGKPYDAVAILWALDCHPNDSLTIEAMDRDATLTWEGALVLFQTIAELEAGLRPQVCAVTSGMNPVGGKIGPQGLSQSTIRGVLSVAVCEYPALRVRLIDLDPSLPLLSQAGDLLRELTSGDSEQEVAFRDGVRLVTRLHPTTLSEVSEDERVWLSELNRKEDVEPRFSLRAPGAGTIDGLSYHETAPPVLHRGQLEVQVAAAGLNFRDVLKVLGLYPLDGDYESLGDECAGVVSRVGEGVTEFKPGDEVICVGSTCFGSHVVTFEHLTMPKPPHLMFEEAATLPIAFLTAHYSLHEAARLRHGETVLIHAAAGGVGLAAIQIAQRAGAEIIATASGPKQAFLRLLGVGHVLDSRSLDFAEQIRVLTGGRGVNVILNSLSGEAIDKSLSILARYGRFIEIGKRDLYENRKLGLGYFREGITFQSVDLSRVMADKPDLIRRMRHELLECFHSGAFHPLPHRIFAANRIRDAFRTMADAKHIGKIVISLRHADIRITPAPPDSPPFDARACYLITGGSGGFGVEIARAMLSNGARNIVLLGRSAPSSDKAQQALARLASFEDARVTLMQADVSDPEEMAAVFRRLDEEFPPLRGVVHAAGLLEDGPLVQLQPSSFRRVLAPKVSGVWNLHELTRGLQLDFFSITSSSASLLGNAGQANYATANAFLDAFAHYRHRQGLPANVVNFGPLADAGMVARDPGLIDRMARLGVSMLPARKAIEILRAAHLRNLPQIGAVRVRWKRWLDAVGFADVPSKLLDVVQEDEASASLENASNELLQSLRQAAPNERAALVTAYVARSISRVLGISPDKIDPAQPLQTLGLDSLATVELCNRLEGDLGIAVPLGELAKKPSLTQLSAVILQLLPQSESRTA